MAFDWIGKLIGVVIAFIILVIGPTILNQQKLDNLNQRELLNDMDVFLDMVADSGEITDPMLEDFYLACAETGWTVDVDIKRKMKVVNPDGAGGTRTTWLTLDDHTTFNKSDSVILRVRALDYSSGQKLVWMLSNVGSSKFDVTMTRSIRN